MKITQWLGYNEESSQYILRRGELRALINLQPRRPGMLISRPGMQKIYGSYSEEPVFGIYRKDTPFTSPDVYLVFHKVLVPKDLTPAEEAAKMTPFEYVWMVSRLQGNPLQSRVIDEQPLSPNGVTKITNMSVSEDRHGRLFIFYGHGAKPVMYRPAQQLSLVEAARSNLSQPLYPIRILHVGGALSFNNWAKTASTAYAWGGGTGDLHVLGTIEYPNKSATVSVQESAVEWIQDNPGYTLTYASLEVLLVDAANRLVGWARTSTSNVVGTTHGTGGTYMTVEPLSFESLAGPWVTGDSGAPGTPYESLVPLEPYKDLTLLVPSVFPELDPDDPAVFELVPETSAVEMGMAAPPTPPEITPDGNGYFLERVDVTSYGGSYWGPPEMTVSGGSPDRDAKVKAVMQSGLLIGAEVIDGGSNYQSFPQIRIATDKIGTGFRGVGVLESDPGVHGFSQTVAGEATQQGVLADGELYGINNDLNGNKILYLSSPLAATTTSTYTTNQTDITTMVVESVANVQPGDFVTVFAGTKPAGLNNANSPVRVVSVNGSTSTVTLTKPWSPIANTEYRVQFRRNTTVAEAAATFDSSTNKFTAAIPVRTMTGAGDGASVNMTFSALSDGFALGTVNRGGYTVPTGGLTPSQFGYKVDPKWTNYVIKGPNYWNGNPSMQPRSGDVRVYAGLQASGSEFVYGYSGSVTTSNRYRGTTTRRADVYYPDYSKISVWLATGTLDGTKGQWQRYDATVQYSNGGDPYIDVTLAPAAKQRTTVRTRFGRKSTRLVPYTKRPGARSPVVRIHLQYAPEEWTITDASGMNKVSSNKETSEAKIGWWNSAGTTPRPIVEFGGSTERVDQDKPRIDYSTVEVLDPGQGWERGTVFGVRFFQANPFQQKADYKVGVREKTIKGTHTPFGKSSRYAEFVFEASSPDASVAGPPARISGPQYITASGTGYRNTDRGGITLLKRHSTSALFTKTATFVGYISGDGRATELTYADFTGSGTFTQSGNTVTVTLANHGLTVGDSVSLAFSVIALPAGSFRVKSVPTAGSFTVQHLTSASYSGTVTVTMVRRQGIGGTIVRHSGDALTTAIRTRDTLRCTTPNVLFDFSQIMQVDSSTGTIGLDKMVYPRDSLTGTFSGTATASQQVNGTTQITGIIGSIDYLVAGQQLLETTSRMSSPLVTITKVEVLGDGTTTITVQAIATSTGTVTFRPAFTFESYSGVSEATTLRWTASQISQGDATSKRITGVRILSGGRNYLTPPTLMVRGGGAGYGLSCKANVENGAVTSVTILDAGKDYTAAPEIYADASPAEATPVMRPALRGNYRCAYRFVDRSETLVRSDLIVSVREDRRSVQLVGGSDNITAGMELEAPLLPRGTLVTGVNDRWLTLSQDANGSGYLSAAVIENGGTGYTETEAITVRVVSTGQVLSQTGSANVIRRAQNSDGTYTITELYAPSSGSTLYSVGKHDLVFSAPAAGGSAATGYAYPSTLAPSVDRSVKVRDLTKPIGYSNFSPIVDVDAGPNDEREHSAELIWSLEGVTPPERADLVEFFRTSSDQSLVFYRLDMYGKPGSDGVEIIGTDTLSDEELFDPERLNYAAMPVVLPNGNLNAYRFGQPRPDMSVCVAFQDRLWYGVSTSGKYPNTLFYSEFDEFESCPDANELPIQNNQRSTDSLTALVPYGSMLLAMQHNHTYAVTYNTDPSLDSSIQMLAHRGCLNQRCWDIHDNLLYAADENGIYVLARNGEVKPISIPVREYFTSELLDLSKRDTFFLTVCPKSRILRFFCSTASQPTPTPSMAMCYHVDMGTWWVERFPNSMACAVTGRPAIGRNNCTIYGASDGNLYHLSGHEDSAFRGLLSVIIANYGDGYATAPTITCPAGNGVQLQGVVNEGRLVDALIHSSGWDIRHGFFITDQDGNPLTTPGGPFLVTVEPAPIPLTISPPSPGGTQAVAYGVYTNINRTVRRAEAVAGRDYISLLRKTVEIEDLSASPFMHSEADEQFVTNQDNAAIRLETTSIEPGAEVFSECLPLGVVVKQVLGKDVYLEYSNGKPVKVLSTLASVQVVFIQKYRSHVPFRLATGSMQLINETNVQKGGDMQVDRSITVLYSPTKEDKYLELVEYYNASGTPRPNTMRRNRPGPGGFIHREDSASTALNIAESASDLASATGVAKATFAARTHADRTGADRHLRVELHGRIQPSMTPADPIPQEFVLHSVTIDGVIEDAE